jgi:hypothetical protein
LKTAGKSKQKRFSDNDLAQLIAKVKEIGTAEG